MIWKKTEKQLRLLILTMTDKMRILELIKYCSHMYVIIVVKIVTEKDRTKCWNAILRRLLKPTEKFINCFKRDTFRNSMLFITILYQIQK